MKFLKSLIVPWLEYFAWKRKLRAYDAGFEYALSVLTEETDPELHSHLREQADSDLNDPFCIGMRMAIQGWKP